MDLTTEDILNSIKNNNASGKLPIQTLGMPGASHVMGMANNIAQAVPTYAKDVFERMKRAVTQGPYSSPTGEYDPSIGTLPLEVMAPGYGRAVGVGSSGGRFRAALSGKKTGFFSNDVRESMSRISERLGDVPEKIKIQEFRNRFPDYQGSDSTIRREFARNEGRGIYARPSNEVELGAFGGRGRLNTDSPGEAIGRLQEQLPVTKEWVENWAKDAGVEVKAVKESKEKLRKGQEHPTTYYKMKDNAGRNVEVRVPGDEYRHIGYPNRGKEGSFFDTGTGIPRSPTLSTMEELSPSKRLLSYEMPNGGVMAPRYTPNEGTLINQAGMPYSNKEALDAALKWRLSKAPYGGNWLVPEEMAPRIPTKSITEVPPNIKPDPNQLKLLSTGFTPYDILKALNGQQNNN